MQSNHAIAEKHFAVLDTQIFAGDGHLAWSGPVDNCDVCSRPMGGETYMIDGPAEAGGHARWGVLCVVCAFKSSPSVGWGKAQLYKRSGQTWFLIAGGPPPTNEPDN